MIARASGTSRAARGGRSFWAGTRTAITAIQATLITPAATSIAISAALEPTQHAPNPEPGPAICWQRRRKCRLSGVSSHAPAAIATAPATAVPCGRHTACTTTPASAQAARQDPANSGTARTPPARAARATAGAAPGSIIAAIITTHAAAKNAGEPSSVPTPISIPVICQTETTQHAAASPSVAVSAAAAGVLTAVTAGAEVVGAPGFQARRCGGGAGRRAVGGAGSSVMTASSSGFCVRGFGEPFDRGQAPVPLGGELGHGPGGLVEAAGLDLVEDLPALLAPADQPGPLEHDQMLADGLAGERYPPG